MTFFITNLLSFVLENLVLCAGSDYQWLCRQTRATALERWLPYKEKTPEAPQGEAQSQIPDCLFFALLFRKPHCYSFCQEKYNRF